VIGFLVIIFMGERALNNITTLTMNPAIDVNTSVDNVSAERKLRCSSPTREPGGGELTYREL
jgi:6-phosphofructokinase 2